MTKETTKNNIITILLCIIFLLIGIIFGVVIDKKLSKNGTNISPNELPTNILGEWGMCESEYNCRGLIIAKNNENKYVYTPYIMWSDGSMTGTVEKITETTKNNYEITVHFPGFSNELGSAPEQTNTYNLDITNLSSNTLIVNNIKFQKITTDRETFFNSIMNKQ